MSASVLAVGSLYVAQGHAATFNCNTSADFSAALTNCTQGDTIILTAGNTFVAPGSGFVLPYKNSSTSYITIQSSALSSLPADRRVSASDEQYMPKIQAQGGQGSYSAIRTAAGVAIGPHHYKFLGIAFTSSADNIQQTTVVRVGNESSAQDTLAEVPNNFIFDRCIIRANSTTSEIRHGINLDAAYVDIINSRIADIKALTTSGDSTGISGSNGPGPFNIINNYIEAASENFILGGSTCYIPNMIASDVVIRKNHFNKPFAAWQSSSWNVKNLFELKAGQRVRIEGNLFENSWGVLQEGKAITLKTERHSGHGSAWTDTKDITVVNNLVRNVGVGFSIGGSTSTTGGTLNGSPSNVTVRNNLFEVNNTMPSNPGELINLSSGPVNVVWDHNTGFAPKMIMDISGAGMPGFVYTNSIARRGTYGIKGQSTTEGSATLDKWFVNGPTGTPVVPPIVWGKNVIQGTSFSSLYLPTYHGGWSTPAWGYPSSWTGVLVNQATPGANYAGYQIVDGSNYDNGGTDGTDPGCNVADVMASIIGADTGVLTHWGYEGFNYPGTGGLNGKTGGVEFGSNAWTAVSGTASPALASGSLNYTDSAGNKLLVGGNKIAPAVNSRSVRNFPSALVTAGKTYWMAYRIKQTGASLPANTTGISLFSGSAGGGTEILIGKASTATNWGIYHSPSGQTVQKSGTANLDVMLISKLTFTGTQASIRLWINPILNEGSLSATPDVQLLNVAHTTNIGSVRIYTGSSSTGYQLDEFRIGNTFADVAPKQ